MLSIRIKLLALSLVHSLQALIDGRVLCVHGGLSPDLRTLDQVQPACRMLQGLCALSDCAGRPPGQVSAAESAINNFTVQQHPSKPSGSSFVMCCEARPAAASLLRRAQALHGFVLDDCAQTMQMVLVCSSKLREQECLAGTDTCVTACGYLVVCQTSHFINTQSLKLHQKSSLTHDPQQCCEQRLVMQIRTIERVCEIPHEGPFCDLMWSDPEETEAWAISPRGAGWLFGARVAAEFNQINGLELICRAHQLVQEGLKYMFPPVRSLRKAAVHPYDSLQLPSSTW